MSVMCGTEDGTAVVGEDYIATSSLLNFESGISFLYYNFSILDDSVS